jgi:hypothetical protein
VTPIAAFPQQLLEYDPGLYGIINKEEANVIKFLK